MNPSSMDSPPSAAMSLDTQLILDAISALNKRFDAFGERLDRRFAASPSVSAPATSVVPATAPVPAVTTSVAPAPSMPPTSTSAASSPSASAASTTSSAPIDPVARGAKEVVDFNPPSRCSTVCRSADARELVPVSTVAATMVTFSDTVPTELASPNISTRGEFIDGGLGASRPCRAPSCQPRPRRPRRAPPRWPRSRRPRRGHLRVPRLGRARQAPPLPPRPRRRPPRAMAQQIASEDGTTNAMLTRCSAFIPSVTNLPAPAARCAEDAISFSWHPMLMQDRPPWPPPFQVEMLVCSIASDLFGRGKSEVALQFEVSSSRAVLFEWGVSILVLQHHLSDVPFLMRFGKVACQIEVPVNDIQLRSIPWPSFSCHLVPMLVQRKQFLSMPSGVCSSLSKPMVIIFYCDISRVWLKCLWNLYGTAVPSARVQLLPSFYGSTTLPSSLVMFESVNNGVDLLLISIHMLVYGASTFWCFSDSNYLMWLLTVLHIFRYIPTTLVLAKSLSGEVIYILHMKGLKVIFFATAVPDQKELLQYLANFILNQQWFTFVQVVGVFFHAHSPSVHLTLWDPGGGLCALAAYKSQITDEAQDLVCCQMNRPYNIELFQLQPLFRANIFVPSSDIVLLLLATVVHVDSGVLDYCSEALLVMSELLSAPMVGIGPWLPPIQLDMQKSVIQLRPIHELSFTGFVVVVLWNKLLPLLFSDSVSKYLRGSLMLSCVQKQWPLLLHLYRSFHQSLPHADFPYVPSDEALILAMATKLWGGSAISVSIRLQCQVAAVLEKYRWSLPHAIIFASLQILLWLSCNQLGISVHAASLLVCNGLLMREFSFSSQRLFMLADFLMGIKIWYMTSIRLSLCIIQFYHLVETNTEQIHFLFEHMARFSLGITGCLHEHTSFHMGIILKVEQELIKLITYWRLLLCVLQFYHQVVDDP